MSEQRIALVTGGTSGVGLCLVRTLTSDGAFVHFVGTNTARGAAIEAELNATRRCCAFWAVDQSSLAATREFAKRFRRDVPRLDLLANVAGVLMAGRRETDEGHEKTFAIGYLSPVLLTLELVGSLERSSAARVINVSGSPRFALRRRLDLDDLAFETQYSGVRAAISTIHAKTVATEILADRLRGRGIDVNAFHPGPVKGQLGRNMSVVKRAIFAAVSLLMSSESQSGAYVSTARQIRGMTGQLFVGETPRALRFEQAYKDALWARTLRMLGKHGEDPAAPLAP